MRNTKRKLITFTFYDRTGIERYLEKQAENGWMLEKTSAFGWVFRRIEPAKVHFAVTYFPSASIFDPGPSEKQLRFQEFCEHTGWELISSNAQLQIFCNRREKPIPIETDPEIEIENIHASAKKSYLPSYFSNLLLVFMQIGLFFQRLGQDAIGAVASSTSLLGLLLGVLLFIASVSEISLYYLWRRKAKAAARDGNFLETKSTVSFQFTILALATVALICMALSYGSISITLSMGVTVLGIVAITAVMLLLSNLMKKRKVSTAANRNITYGAALVMTLLFCTVLVGFIFGRIRDGEDLRAGAETYELNGWTFVEYHDDLPLTVEDLMESSYGDYSYEKFTNESSFLLSRIEARQDGRPDGEDHPELHYHVVTVKIPALYGWCLEQMLAEFSHNYGRPEDETGWEAHESIDPAPWGAEAAYQLVLGGAAQEQYILCYSDRIVEIGFNWEPTAEQMLIVGEKLGTP